MCGLWPVLLERDPKGKHDCALLHWAIGDVNRLMMMNKGKKFCNFFYKSSSEMPTFYQYVLAMRNTAVMTGGKPIAV
jgi:hypothetical protein